MQRKVFVVGGDLSVRNLFNMEGWLNVDNVGMADLVCFTGGADVSPELYNHPKHQATFVDHPRDKREMLVFEESMAKGKKLVGICRGGQFLNVMNGGEMYQDVTNHTRGHVMFIQGEGELVSFDVTSTHHQMMKPAKHGKVLATGPTSKVSYWDLFEEEWKEDVMSCGIEVVRYEHALCFQPHPEFSAHNVTYKKMREYFFAQIEELLGK